MSHTPIEYREVLKRLMPVGRAWSTDPDSVIGQILYGLSEELSRVDERVDSLILELSTEESTELLEEYEEEYGILEPSIVTSERQEAIHSKLVARGRQDKTYFISVALAMGYVATVTEYKPFWMDIGTAISESGDLKNIFYWLIGIDVEGDNTLTDPVDYAQSLTRSFSELILEGNRLKPGHTIALYDFAGCEFSRAFYYMEIDAAPTNDDTIPIEQFDRNFSTDFSAQHEYDGTYLTGAFGKGFEISYDAHVGGAFRHDSYDAAFERTT